MKWEYKIVHFDTPMTMPVPEYVELVEPKLNALGAEGWESIRIQPNMVWFKRQVTE